MTTQEILTAARDAKRTVGVSGTAQRNRALLGMADALDDAANRAAILSANAADLDAARGHISEVMLDRLALNGKRLDGMSQGIREVAALPDPVGAVLRRIERPNGLVIEKTAVPMGVIAIIYESRPNVTSDAAALALKSGNACVLRCGKEAWRTSKAIVDALRQGVTAAGLPAAAVNLIEDTTRASSYALMEAVGYVDLLIPRGGAGLIRACVENAKVPCIQTGTGICHIYVDDTADQAKALDIIENAKASRPSVCNAEEVCLVHKDIAAQFLPKLPSASAPTARPAASTRWSCGWTRVPRPSSPAPPPAPRTSTPNFWTTSWRWASWTAQRTRWPTSPPTPPATATPSSARRPATSTCSPRRWTARRSTSTAPPVSPTGASSAWGAKWASPPRSCTPAAPWAWPSCAPTNTSSGATARSAHKTVPIIIRYSGALFCPVQTAKEPWSGKLHGS